MSGIGIPVMRLWLKGFFQLLDSPGVLFPEIGIGQKSSKGCAAAAAKLSFHKG
jgi:hypothetical protein